ncbi:MAG: hypothetical protein ACJ77K_14640 [Bacteroidia bacterium]
MNVFKTGFFALLFAFFIGEGQSLSIHNHASVQVLTLSQYSQKNFCLPINTSTSEFGDEDIVDDDDNFDSDSKTVMLIGTVLLLFLFFEKNLNQFIALIRQSACFLRLLTDRSFLGIFRI